MRLVIQPGAAKQFGVQVHCDKDGGNGFPITVDRETKTMLLESRKVPFELKADEELTLRVFLDKSIIEVFVNDRQAAIAPHMHAPENLGVSIFSKGGDVAIKEAKGWKMKSIYSAN